MDNKTLVYLMQLVLLYGAHQTHERLPKYVFIKKSCPNPNNIIEWEKASNRLNCLHPPNSTDTGNAYHCLPTSFLNETVEFCGEGISVPPGYCPIYNYTDTADDKPGLYNCYAFKSGCPTESFSSNDVRKFPSCLNINREHGCYEEESSCPKTSVTPVPKDTTINVKTTTFPTLQSIPTCSSPDISTADNHDKAPYVPSIIIIGSGLIIGLFTITIISLGCLYKYRCLYLQMKKDATRTDESTYIKMKNMVTSSNEVREELKPFIQKNYTDQNAPNIMPTNCDSSCKTEDLNAPNKTNCDESCQTKVTMESNQLTLKFKEFDNFLETIGSCITDEMWQSMRQFLLEGILNRGYIAKLKTTRMLFELSELFTFQYNIPFLELIFTECDKDDLVQKCKMFTAKNKFEFQEFQANFKPCEGNEHVKFMMTKIGKESITVRINNLRNWIGKTVQVHPGRILMTSLNLHIEPIAVTFMMNEKHVNSLLDNVKTDDGQFDLFHKGVKKIIQDENVFEIVKALNGEHFLKLHLSSNELCDNNIMKAAACAIKKTGLQMVGNEIYKSDLPNKQKGKEEGDELSSKRKLIKKNRDSLLEDIEPMMICDTEMTLMFEENDIMMMKNIQGRRKRAESFLQMCDKLPNDKFERIFSSYFVKHLTSSEKVLNYEEIGPLRNWIQQKPDDLLDEIDSDFIKTTIRCMENVHEEDEKKLLDPEIGRKTKAQNFLDFVQKSDDYVKALQKTMKERDIQFPK